MSFTDFIVSTLAGAVFLGTVYGIHTVGTGLEFLSTALVAGMALSLCVASAVKGVVD